MARRWMAVMALAAGMAFGGCKRRAADVPAATGSGATTTAMAATLPVQQAGADVMLMIDGAPVAFPAVSMRAVATGGGVNVRLSTPTADPQSGNSLFFDLTLADVDGPANLPGATWAFHNDDAERADTLNGIFLYGRAAVLEPKEVTISFGSEKGRSTVSIEGEFRLFDPPDAAAAQKAVTVRGKFDVAAH